MTNKTEIYKVYDTHLTSQKKENRIKEKLMLNIWYNEFGLVYLKSFSLLKDSL